MANQHIHTIVLPSVGTIPDTDDQTAGQVVIMPVVADATHVPIDGPDVQTALDEVSEYIKDRPTLAVVNTALTNYANAFSLSQNAQNTQITNLQDGQTAAANVLTAHDASIVALNTSQATQDIHLTALDADQVTQNTHLNALDASQVVQDNEIAALQGASGVSANAGNDISIGTDGKVYLQETETTVDSFALSGNNLVIKYTGENGIQQVKSVDLTPFTADINLASGVLDNPSAGVYNLILTDTDGSTVTLDLASLLAVVTTNTSTATITGDGTPANPLQVIATQNATQVPTTAVITIDATANPIATPTQTILQQIGAWITSFKAKLRPWVKVGSTTATNNDSVSVSDDVFHLGKVGVGTSTPDALLTVGDGTSNGYININRNLQPHISFKELGVVKARIQGTNNRFEVTDNTGALAHLSVNSANGHVGIGTTTPTEKLEVVGNIKASGTVSGTSFITTSQLDKKENVKPISLQEAKAILGAMDAIKFKYKEEFYPEDQSVHFGYGADAIAKVSPDLISKTTIEDFDSDGSQLNAINKPKFVFDKKSKKSKKEQKSAFDEDKKNRLKEYDSQKQERQKYKDKWDGTIGLKPMELIPVLSVVLKDLIGRVEELEGVAKKVKI